MSKSMHVVGIRPLSQKWKNMKAAFDACRVAGVEVPEEVLGFFKNPDSLGVRVPITVSEYSGDGEEGYEVCIEDIPKDVKVIRFYNSH